MNLPSRRVLAAVVSFVAIPCVFFAVLIGWFVIDSILGAREVSQFIRDHQALVARRLADPKVHSFSLTHDPDSPSTLLIQFDVDDKATYLMLEEDLGAFWGLRFPPRWKTHLRSKEDLGNNYGFAAQGIGEVAEFLRRIMIAAVASFCIPACCLVIALFRLRSRPIKASDHERLRPGGLNNLD